MADETAQTVVQQIDSTRAQLSSAVTSVENIRPTSSQQTLRAKQSKTAGGRTGTMAGRLTRKTQKLALDKFKAEEIASLKSQSADFETSVAKGVPEHATPEALARVTTEAKNYINDKIDYLKTKVQKYKDRADYYDDKADDATTDKKRDNYEIRERAADYDADNYEAELKSWQKALTKPQETFIKEYYTGYTKDIARYARDKEEARNDYKLAKYKGEKEAEQARVEMISKETTAERNARLTAEMRQKGYEYVKNNPQAFSGGASGDLYKKTLLAYKMTPEESYMPADQAKAAYEKRITMEGREAGFAYLEKNPGAFGGTLDVAAMRNMTEKEFYTAQTPQMTMSQSTTAPSMMGYSSQSQQMVALPSTPAPLPMSSMDSTASAYRKLFGEDYKAANVKEIFNPKPLEKFQDKIVVIDGPSTQSVSAGYIPTLPSKSYSNPEMNLAGLTYIKPDEKTTVNGLTTTVTYKPSDITRARIRIDKQISAFRNAGEVAKITSADLALAAGVDAYGNQLSGKDYLAAMYPSLLGEERIELTEDEKKMSALARKYEAKRKKELKDAGVVTIAVDPVVAPLPTSSRWDTSPKEDISVSNSFLKAEGLGGEQLFTVRKDSILPWKQGSKESLGSVQIIDSSGKKRTVDRSQLVPYTPKVDSKEGYFEEVSHTIPGGLANIFLGQGVVKEYSLKDKADITSSASSVGGYFNPVTQHKMVEASTNLRQLKDKAEQLYLASITSKEKYNAGKITQAQHTEEMRRISVISKSINQEMGTGEFAPSSLVNQYFKSAEEPFSNQAKLKAFSDPLAYNEDGEIISGGKADRATKVMVDMINRGAGEGTKRAKIGGWIMTKGGEVAKFAHSARYDTKKFGVGVATGVVQVAPYLAPAGAVIMGADLAANQGWQATKTTKSTSTRVKAGAIGALGAAIAVGGGMGVAKSFGTAAETGARAVTGPVGKLQSSVLSRINPATAYAIQEGASTALVVGSGYLGAARSAAVVKQTGSYAGGFGVGVGSALPLAVIATAKASPLKIRELRIPKTGQKSFNSYERILDKFGRKTGAFKLGTDRETVIQLVGLEKPGYVTASGKIVPAKARVLAYGGTGFETGKEIGAMTKSTKALLRPGYGTGGLTKTTLTGSHTKIFKDTIVKTSQGKIKVSVPLATMRTPRVFESSFKVGLGTPNIQRDLFSLSTDVEKGAIEMSSGLATSTLSKNLKALSKTGTIDVTRLGVIEYGKKLVVGVGEVPTTIKRPEELYSATKNMPRVAVKKTLDIARKQNALVFGGKPRMLYTDREFSGYSDFQAVSRGTATPESIFTAGTYNKIKGRLTRVGGYDYSTMNAAFNPQQGYGVVNPDKIFTRGTYAKITGRAIRGHESVVIPRAATTPGAFQAQPYNNLITKTPKVGISSINKGQGYDASGIFTAKTASKIVGKQNIPGKWAWTKVTSDVDLRYDYASPAQMRANTDEFLKGYHKLGKVTQGNKVYDFSKAREVRAGEFQRLSKEVKAHDIKVYGIKRVHSLGENRDMLVRKTVHVKARPGIKDIKHMKAGGEYQIEIPIYDTRRVLRNGKWVNERVGNINKYGMKTTHVKYKKVVELKGPDMDEVADPFTLGTQKAGAPIQLAPRSVTHYAKPGVTHSVSASKGTALFTKKVVVQKPVYGTSLAEETRNLSGSVFSVRKVVDPTTGKTVLTILPPAKRLKDIGALSTSGRTVAADAAREAAKYKATVTSLRGTTTVPISPLASPADIARQTKIAGVGKEIGKLTEKIESYYPTHLVRANVAPEVLADFRAVPMASPSISGLKAVFVSNVNPGSTALATTGQASPTVTSGSTTSVASPSPSPSRLFMVSPSASQTQSPSRSVASRSPGQTPDPSYAHTRSPSPISLTSSPSPSPSISPGSPSIPSPSSPSRSPGSPSPSTSKGGGGGGGDPLPIIPIVPPTLYRRKSQIMKNTQKKVAPQGYEAFVRVKGKYVSLAPFATTKEEAIAIGAEKVLGGAAATFKVVRSKKTFKSTGKSASAAKLGTFFRPSKANEYGVYIQKKDKRITSLGEKREIQMLGTKAVKVRSAKKKKAVKKKVVKKKIVKKKTISKKKGGKK